MDVIFFYGALILYVVGTLAHLLLLWIKGGPLSHLRTAATVGRVALHHAAALARPVALPRPGRRSVIPIKPFPSSPGRRSWCVWASSFASGGRSSGPSFS